MELWLRAEATWESERRKRRGAAKESLPDQFDPRRTPREESPDQTQVRLPAWWSRFLWNRSRTTENDERT